MVRLRLAVVFTIQCVVFAVLVPILLPFAFVAGGDLLYRVIADFWVQPEPVGRHLGARFI